MDHRDHHHQHQQRRRSRSRSPPRRQRGGRDERSYPSGTIPPGGSRLIIVPTNIPQETKQIVDAVADFVARGGMPLEEDIARLQAHNPNFAFIRAPWNDPVSVYYRWKLYSLLQGDGLNRWRTDPYQIEAASDRWWVPPPLPGTARAYNPGVPAHALGEEAVSRAQAPAAASVDPEFLAFISSKGLNTDPLPFAERAQWFKLLRNVRTAAATPISDAMVFAIEHSAWAYDVLESVVDSMGLDALAEFMIGAVGSLGEEGPMRELSTRLERSMARLFLLSDILSNVFAASSATHAAPRQLIKAADFVLPRLFEQVMALTVVVLSAQYEDRSWSNVVIEPNTALWQLIGWVRECWALWVIKGCVSADLTDLIKRQYAFLLAPTSRLQAQDVSV
jgi:hypothetical protein